MFSACFSESHRFLNEVVTARTAQFPNVTLFDRKEAARVWPVFVYPAKSGPVRVFLEKRTLEEQLATGATAVTFAAPQRKGGDHLLFAKVCVKKAANLSLRLARAQLRVFHLSGPKALCQSLFKRALSCPGSVTR